MSIRNNLKSLGVPGNGINQEEAALVLGIAVTQVIRDHDKVVERLPLLRRLFKGGRRVEGDGDARVLGALDARNGRDLLEDDRGILHGQDDADEAHIVGGAVVEGDVVGRDEVGRVCLIALGPQDGCERGGCVGGGVGAGDHGHGEGEEGEHLSGLLGEGVNE